ncbi:MAG: HNH endonuclease family protein [Candidatus Nomurabacteria bacterium]|jgi:hypothetical protein|nr:HNH endonuclease family protein [Candidatus Nomurabacteria bacterium]
MRKRRIFGILFLLATIFIAVFINEDFSENPILDQNPNQSQISSEDQTQNTDENLPKALEKLSEIPIKGRAPKTGYSRDQFGNGWGEINGCDTRNVILFRDLTDKTMKDNCLVATGILQDPYTGKTIQFSRADNASAVQIDHIVPLSDAWQKGAQYWEKDKRKQFANDPLNLLASDGPANMQKSDSDAANWLPSNKSFRCYYIARQITIKLKYDLWNTEAETAAMQKVLEKCPDQRVLE